MRLAISAALFLSVAFAQTAPDAGWRRVADDPETRPVAPAPQEPSYGPIAPKLTIKAGTYITVRTNQMLSSDRSQQGDAFTATLTQPIVVDGVVLAERGQTVGGRVSEVDKGSRIKGNARLGLQITDLTLADGQQVNVESLLTARKGSTSKGEDQVGAVATTTGIGAMVGAVADGGRGAGIGAGVGAAAGLAGVLLTRSRPAVVYPESVLSFRIQQPIVVSTERAPQAFRYVSPEDYTRNDDLHARNTEQRPRRTIYYGYGYPWYWGSPYPYWGSGIGFYYYGGRHWGHRYHRR